ncbi:hypothetical protein SynA1825c_02866 [Synechococcus sp. A18-25c]|nr:hypothetical protein SynA1825c_02866 [Synechococcus sp. A18-25c]
MALALFSAPSRFAMLPSAEHHRACFIGDLLRAQILLLSR